MDYLRLFFRTFDSIMMRLNETFEKKPKNYLILTRRIKKHLF